jgi:hypothetical protein
MLTEVIDWGIKPRIVTGDSWYSGVENLKFLRNQKLGFLFGVEKNRTVSNQPRKYCQVGSLEIPDQGLITHLKEFGFIKLFRKDFKKEDSISNWYQVQRNLFTLVVRDYIVDNLTNACAA